MVVDAWNLELGLTRDPKPLFASGKSEGLNVDKQLFGFEFWDLNFGIWALS